MQQVMFFLLRPLFQMIILPFIPILALLVQTVYMLTGILEYRHEISEIETQVGLNTNVFLCITRFFGC